MKVHEHALLFLRKAEQDDFVLELLLRLPESPDEVIGFHAQQAVEKRAKPSSPQLGYRFAEPTTLLNSWTSQVIMGFQSPRSSRNCVG